MITLDELDKLEQWERESFFKRAWSNLETAFGNVESLRTPLFTKIIALSDLMRVKEEIRGPYKSFLAQEHYEYLTKVEDRLRVIERAMMGKYDKSYQEEMSFFKK